MMAVLSLDFLNALQRKLRAFAHSLQQTPSSGAYLSIETAISEEYPYLSTKFAALFPTTL